MSSRVPGPAPKPSLTLCLPLVWMVLARFNEGDPMSDPVGIAGDRIRSFVERIEQLDTELQEINEQKKEVFSEAKGEGFDVEALKEIIRLRKQDQDERDEHETLLDVYLRAMDTVPPEPIAAAAEGQGPSAGRRCPTARLQYENRPEGR